MTKHKFGEFITTCPHCGSDNWDFDEHLLLDKAARTLEIDFYFTCSDCEEPFDQSLKFKLGECLADDANK